MTQIRSMTQPVQRRPGELGVHSLDHFNFVVPDVAEAEKFYGLFGLNTKEEDGKLGALHAGPSAPLGHRRRRAAQEVQLRLVRRLRGRHAALPRAAGEDAHRPARSAQGLRVERAVVPRSGRHADRDPRRGEKLAQRQGDVRDEGRRCRPPERAEPQQGAHRCSRAGSRTCCCSSPTYRAPSRSTATCLGCGCRTAPAISSPSCTASTAATIT